MAKQTINIGTSPNDGSGDPLRTAFTKTNQNFDEVYLDIQDLEANSITETELNTALSFKVDKVTGKGLSTEDYTTAEKNKLAALAAPLLSQDYAGELNLSTGGEVSYKIYSVNAAHTPTVTALAENSVARVVLDAGSSASLVDTNLGTKRAGSDDFTVSKQNELLVFVFPDGTDGALVKSYTIKVLN